MGSVGMDLEGVGKLDHVTEELNSYGIFFFRVPEKGNYQESSFCEGGKNINNKRQDSFTDGGTKMRCRGPLNKNHLSHVTIQSTTPHSNKQQNWKGGALKPSHISQMYCNYFLQSQI